MDTELGRILKTIWRWIWLIVLCVLLAGGATWYSLYRAAPMYEASATLQFSTPDRTDVELVDKYKFVSARDEITVAISRFIEIAENDNVRNATISKLNLSEPDTEYELTIDFSPDADFVNVTIAALDPTLAADLVNTHSEVATEQYGELRARPASELKIYFEEQIQVIEVQASDADARLEEFRGANNITFLETEKKLSQDALIQLQAQQTQLVAEDAIGQARKVVQLQTRIGEQRAELERLASLEPEYNRLARESEQINETQELLLSRYTEANFKEVLARKVSFIQMVTPAQPPTEPASGQNSSSAK